MKVELAAPRVVDRTTFQAELDALRVREKAHNTGRRRDCGRPPAASNDRG